MPNKQKAGKEEVGCLRTPSSPSPVWALLPFGDNKGMVGRDGGGISTMGYSDISACAFLAFRCPFCGDKCAFLFVVITFVGALYSVSVCLH